MHKAPRCKYQKKYIYYHNQNHKHGISILRDASQWDLFEQTHMSSKSVHVIWNSAILFYVFILSSFLKRQTTWKKISIKNQITWNPYVTLSYKEHHDRTSVEIGSCDLVDSCSGSDSDSCSCWCYVNSCSNLLQPTSTNTDPQIHHLHHHHSFCSFPVNINHTSNYLP